MVQVEDRRCCAVGLGFKSFVLGVSRFSVRLLQLFAFRFVGL